MKLITNCKTQKRFYNKKYVTIHNRTNKVRMWFEVSYDTLGVIFVYFVVVLKFVELWNKNFDFILKVQYNLQLL